MLCGHRKKKVYFGVLWHLLLSDAANLIPLRKRHLFVRRLLFCITAGLAISLLASLTYYCRKKIFLHFILQTGFRTRNCMKGTQETENDLNNWISNCQVSVHVGIFSFSFFFFTDRDTDRGWDTDDGESNLHCDIISTFLNIHKGGLVTCCMVLRTPLDATNYKDRFKE